MTGLVKTALMAAETKTPSIPSVTAGNLTEVARAIKETLEVREGLRGDPLDQVVTHRELVTLNLAKVGLGGRGLPTSPVIVVSPGTPDGYDPVADLTTPPQPEDVSGVSGYETAQLRWTVPLNYRNHAHAEIWRSGNDVLGNAILVGRDGGWSFTDRPGLNQTFYYWVRFVSQANITGPWQGTAGISITTSYDVDSILTALQGQVTSSMLHSTLGSRVDLIDAPTTGLTTKILDLQTTYGTTVSAATSAADAATSLAAAIVARNTAQGYASDANTSKVAAQSANTTASGSASAAATSAANAATSLSGAIAASTTAQGYASDASASKVAAQAANTAAAGSASAAATSATSAAAFKTSAESASTAATSAKVAAESARDTAGTSAAAAATSATTAATQATAAGTQAAAAQTAKLAAETAQGAASTSSTAAATSATNAATSKAGADSASAAATSAKVAAESARDAAGGSATAAATSATAAATQATSAGTQAAAAQTARLAAETAQGAAVTSSTAAATSATNAAGSATSAGTSATAAANSATAAGGSASAAATSATSAATQATAAGTQAAAAQTAKLAAETAQGAASTSSTAAAVSATNAATSKTGADSASAAATSAKVAAESARDAAGGSATAAATSATAAGTLATAAGVSSTAAQAAKVSAESARDAASGSATAAGTSATTASTQATAAGNSATAATAAKVAAESARTAASGSATAAATSASTASTQATNSGNSATAAAAAKVAAESARDAASGSATAAATSASSASTQATNSGNSATAAAAAKVAAESARDAALGSATAAATSASTASTQATAAGTQATAAQNSATSATTQAANALTYSNSASSSATSASGSATSAASSLNALKATATGFDATLAWNFDTSADGWVATGATLAAASGVATITSSGTDPVLLSPTGLAIAGGTFPLIRARVKRMAGAGWDGAATYSTSSHGISAAYSKTVSPDPTSTTEWRVIEWDMSALTSGGSDWVSNTITQIRLDLGATAADVFQVDWVTVGRVAPVAYSVAIAQEASVRASNDGTLFAQYTVKIDANGYVSGFGLASTANNATPSSAFAVRADQFYVASPSGPGVAPASPFYVQTTATTINGVAVPVGVYMSAAFIANGTIVNAKIGNAAIDDAKIASVSADKITAGTIGVGRYIGSNNYVAGTSGWRINGDGTAQLMAAHIAGQLTAAQIDTRGLSIRDALGNVILAAGSALDWSNVGGAAKPIQYSLLSRGSSSTTQPAGVVVGVKNLDTATTVAAGARSYTLTIFNRTNGAVQDVRSYDVYAATTLIANALLQSDDLSAAPWVSDANPLAVTPNAATGPDGVSIIAGKLSESTLSSSQVRYQPYVIAAGGTWVFHATLKPDGRGLARLSLGTSGIAIGVDAYFDLTAGAVALAAAAYGGATSPVATVAAAGNGFYRCSIACTFPAATTIYAGIYVRSALNNASYVGSSGLGILACNAQLEPVSAPRKYRPTVAAPAYLDASVLATDLMALTSANTFALTTWDEPANNRLTGGLPAAIYANGGTPGVFESPFFHFRGAYLLVGIGGCGQGNALLEMYQGDVDNSINAWCMTTLIFQNGMWSAGGSSTATKTVAGANLYDSAGTLLTDLSIKNDQIFIGGTNFWKSSASATGFPLLTGSATVTEEDIALPDGSTGAAIKIVTTSSTTIRARNALRGNGLYSLALWHKVSSGAVAWSADMADVTGLAINSSTAWQQSKLEGATVANYTSATYHFVDLNLPAGITLYLWHPKIEYGNKATTWTPAPEDVATSITAAKAAADAANTALANIASDSILSPSEKPTVVQDYNVIIAEQTGIDAQATAFAITTEKTAYDSAVATLTTYLGALTGWNTVPGSDVAIVGATFRANFANVYTARQALLNKISAQAKALADAAQATGTSAAAAATAAQTTASAASTNASAALTQLTNLASDNILSAVEKPTVVRDYAVITGEQAGIDAQATAYGITTEKTTYDAAVTALTAYLGTLTGWNTIPGGDVTIVGTTFRQKFSDVYAAKQALLNKIAAAAGTVAAWSGVSGAGKPLDNAGRIVDGGEGTTVFGQRQRNDPPSEYPAGLTMQFKAMNILGLTATGNGFCTLETNKGFATNDGINVIQYAYDNSGKTYKRWGLPAATTWGGAWVLDLDRASYTGALDATKGATFGVDIGGQITAATASTFIANAAIGSAQVGTLQAGNIAAGAIQAQHMLITPRSLMIDPDFAAGGSGWATFVQRLPASNAAVPAGCPREYAAQFSGRDNYWAGARITCYQGEQYRLTVLGHANGGSGGGGIGVLIYGYNPSGQIVYATGFGNSNAYPSSWVTYGGTWSVPAGIASFTIGPWVDKATFPVAVNPWFTDIRAERLADANLIVDGAITANKVGANQIITQSANIGNAVVNTLQIAGEAIIVPRSASATNTTGTGVVLTLPAITLPAEAATATIVLIASIDLLAYVTDVYSAGGDAVMFIYGFGGIQITRNGSVIYSVGASGGGSNSGEAIAPLRKTIQWTDNPGAGTHTYDLRVVTGGGSGDRALLALGAKR
ncbi:MAG: hypothetical protein ABI574_00955 [Burkholderiales bacterium]